MESVPDIPRLAGPTGILGALLLVVASSQASAQCATGTSVTQWHCWEQTITSNVDLYNGGTGNPYRDLVLRVTFSWPGVTNFTQDAFWAGDPAGNIIVVWSSYGQDGDFGGIYGQLYDPKGKPIGGEFQINSMTSGHQVRPQVTYLAGDVLAVGWTTEALGSEPGALSVRVFDRNGLPVTAEIRSPGSASLHPELVDLEPDSSGGFSLQWQLRDNTRKTITSYLQRLTNQGMAAGAPGVLP